MTEEDYGKSPLNTSFQHTEWNYSYYTFQIILFMLTLLFTSIFKLLLYMHRNVL